MLFPRRLRRPLCLLVTSRAMTAFVNAGIVAEKWRDSHSRTPFVTRCGSLRETEFSVAGEIAVTVAVRAREKTVPAAPRSLDGVGARRNQPAGRRCGIRVVGLQLRGRRKLYYWLPSLRRTSRVGNSE